MHPDWLSNAYLVADEPGGHGVIIDSGAPPEPLLEAIEQNDLTVKHLLLTHHQQDLGVGLEPDQGAGIDHIRGAEGVDHGRLDEAAARDGGPPGPHRPNDDR